MTNEEKALEIATNNGWTEMDFSKKTSAIQMAKWKDEQFAKERQELIDKAWKWMQEHINLIGSPMELHMSFRKAMEEE